MACLTSTGCYEMQCYVSLQTKSSHWLQCKYNIFGSVEANLWCHVCRLTVTLSSTAMKPLSLTRMYMSRTATMIIRNTLTLIPTQSTMPHTQITLTHTQHILNPILTAMMTMNMGMTMYMMTGCRLSVSF